MKLSVSEVARELHNYSRKGKHSGVVAAHLGWLIDACSRYRDDFQFADPRLRKHRDITDRQSKRLVSLYTSKLIGNQDSLRELGRTGACCYCGITNGVTLDHYLPKDPKWYPHLSYFLPNLVPACGSCQGTKGNFSPRHVAKHPLFVKGRSRRKDQALGSLSRSQRGTFRSINTSRLIHPHFDHCIDPGKISMQFVVDAVAGPHSLRLVYDKGRRSPAGRLFRSHVAKLDLDRKVGIDIQNQWKILINTLRDRCLGASRADIESALLLLQTNRRHAVGIGSMESVFLSSVIKSNQCIKLIQAKLQMPIPKPSRRR